MTVSVLLVLGVSGLLLLVVSLVGGRLSTAALGGFLGGLGFTGLLAQGPLGTLPALAFGAGVGLGVAALTVGATRALRRSESGPARRTVDLVGAEAVVLTPVPTQGLGVVVLREGGQRVQVDASSAGALPSGARVRVAEVVSPTAVRVEPLGPPDLPDPLPLPEPRRP